MIHSVALSKFRKLALLKMIHLKLIGRVLRYQKSNFAGPPEHCLLG